MVNHPNRNPRRAVAKIVLANGAGSPIEERFVTASKNATDEQIAEATAKAVSELVLERTWLRIGETITVEDVI